MTHIHDFCFEKMNFFSRIPLNTKNLYDFHLSPQKEVMKKINYHHRIDHCDR